MNAKSLKSVFCFSLPLALALQTHAATIADWTFETSAPVTAGPLSPEIGSGSALGSHVGAAAYSTPAGNGSTHSFSANTWAVGDYWQFQVNTTGFQDIQLSFDQTGSATGPKLFNLEYSTTGLAGSFTTILADYTIALSTWSPSTPNPAFTFTQSFTAITALNNAPTVFFRLVDDSTTSINNSTVATGGTDRVDNFIVTATVVPEPATMAVLGLFAAGFFFLRRRSI